MKYFIEKKTAKNRFEVIDATDDLEEAQERIKMNPELSIRYGPEATAADNRRRGFSVDESVDAAAKGGHKIL